MKWRASVIGYSLEVKWKRRWVLRWELERKQTRMKANCKNAHPITWKASPQHLTRPWIGGEGGGEWFLVCNILSIKFLHGNHTQPLKSSSLSHRNISCSIAIKWRFLLDKLNKMIPQSCALKQGISLFIHVSIDLWYTSFTIHNQSTQIYQRDHFQLHAIAFVP